MRTTLTAAIGFSTSVYTEAITQYGDLLNTSISSIVQLTIAFITIKNLLKSWQKQPKKNQDLSNDTQNNMTQD